MTVAMTPAEPPSSRAPRAPYAVLEALRMLVVVAGAGAGYQVGSAVDSARPVLGALNGTALGLVLFFRLVVEAGPSRAAVITYVNPLVAVVLGVLVLDERLGAMSILGLLAILGGSWLATRGRTRTDPGARGVATGTGGRR